MKKIIIIALALMFVASPVFAKKPKPVPVPVVEEPAVGPLPSPLPTTTQYFKDGKFIREEVVDYKGNVLSSWSMPTPTPTPQAPVGVPVERTWLDDIQDILNSIQAKINEIVNSLK